MVARGNDASLGTRLPPLANPYYPAERRGEDCTPWLEAFVNARKWVESHQA